MSHKKLMAAIIIIVLSYGGYYWSIQPASGSLESPRYPLTRVSQGTLEQTVATDGYMQPNFKVEVKSKASGEIVRVVNVEGDQVKKGDFLIELNPADEERHVRKMHANLDATRSRLLKEISRWETDKQKIPASIAKEKAGIVSTQVILDEAKKKLKRVEKLHQRKIISNETPENTESTYRRAKADYQQALAALDKALADRSTLEERHHDIALAPAQVVDAEIQLEEAQERLANTRITAPIDGQIISQWVEPGQIIISGISNVSGGTPLLLLADMSKMFVVASVDETDIGQIQVGQEVRLTADAYRERSFSGNVVHIGTQGEVESNVTTFNVKIAVKGGGQSLLKPMMSVNVNILTRHQENALQLISTAIDERRSDKKIVFQLHHGQPVPVSVKTGLSNDMYTEILQGLHAGAEVIANVALLQLERSQSK